MRRSHLAIALVLVLVALGLGIVLNKGQERTPGEGGADVPKFEISLIGDIPYNAEQQRKTEVLFGQMDSEKLAFVVHVGDIKSGDSPCTDEIFFQEKERFESSANPLVYVPGDNEWADCHRTGYNDFLAALEEEVVAFGKPVVLAHGDTHTFRVDKPMTSSTTGERVENFTRVETFDSPDVNWVRATVDTSDPEVFSFQPEIVEENTVEGVP